MLNSQSPKEDVAHYAATILHHRHAVHDIVLVAQPFVRTRTHVLGHCRSVAPARGRGTINWQLHEVPMLDRPAPHELSFPSQRPSSGSSALDRLTAGIGGDAIWLLARCFIGGVFVYSGFGKLTGLDGFAASLAKNGVPMADVMAIVGASVEFFGGLAIVLGLQARYAALLMAAFTISATLISHRFWELQDVAAFKQQSVHFMKNLAILGAFLLLFVQGGGRLSFDGWWRRANKA
jgi:putative oxidoreductase